MIKVFECLGVQTFEKDGKKGTNIYYSEPFDDFEKNCSGVKCNHLFTYKNITVQNRVKNLRLFIRLVLTLRTSVIYRSWRSST